MTLRGFLAVFRANFLDSVFIVLNTNQDLPSIFAAQFGVDRWLMHLFAALSIGGLCILFPRATFLCIELRNTANLLKCCKWEPLYIEVMQAQD